MNDLNEYIVSLARAAKKASVGLRTLSADAKNDALKAMAECHRRPKRAAIRAANATGRRAGNEDRTCPRPWWTGSP